MNWDEFREVKRYAEHSNHPYFVDVQIEDNGDKIACFDNHGFRFEKQAMAYLKFLIKKERKNDKQRNKKNI